MSVTSSIDGPCLASSPNSRGQVTAGLPILQDLVLDSGIAWCICQFPSLVPGTRTSRRVIRFQRMDKRVTLIMSVTSSIDRSCLASTPNSRGQVIADRKAYLLGHFTCPRHPGLHKHLIDAADSIPIQTESPYTAVPTGSCPCCRSCT